MPFKSEKQRKWMHANEPEMAKDWERKKKKSGAVNESSYTQRSILDFIKANKAAVESDPANIPRIKVFGPKQDSKYLNISLAGLAKIAKMVKNESVNEAKKSSYTKDGKLIITKARWLRLPDYAKLRKKGVEHVLSIDPKKKGRSKYIPVQIESVNEALKVVGSENVGTKKYDGKVWYWPHDYRHYLRDASFKQRKAVHNAWVKIGVPVKKTKDGEKWLEPKSNQKKKAWTIVRKAIAPKELGTPIPESVNEAKESPIDVTKRIVKNKQAEKIDGVLVDMQTANLILKVWDAINTSNRKKFEKLPIKKMVNVVWKLVRR